MGSGIYAILQLSTGFSYVGSAKSISDRWRKHLSDLRKGRHHSAKLQNSWNKYGDGDFQFVVIEVCDIEHLIRREQFYLDKMRPYFNILRVARSALGHRHSESSIQKMKAPRLKLTNKRFGLLVAIDIAGRNTSGAYQWNCICDCGNKTIVGASKLKSGHTVSCGCFRREVSRNRSIKMHLTHGLTKTREFVSWTQMKSKCLSKSSFDYEQFGGRGIGVCARWIESFENFLEDMGERPPGTGLSRLKLDEDYSKDNCYWATPRQIANNRRVSVKTTEEI